MARRGHHLTEVALLASASGCLAAAGAGEREGWLDDPAVLLSLGPRARDLAVASAARSVLGIVPVAGGGGVTVKPALGPDDGRISAVEWVPLDAEGAQGEEGMALVAGTDAGWLLFYSLAGDLLHKQSIYPAKILKLNFSERKENAWEDAGSDELSVVFPGVIARCDGADLQIMLQKSFQEVKSRMWKDKFEQEDGEDTSSFEKIPLQIWNVSKFSSCVDAAIVGLMPPPLLELQSSQRHYCAITVGEDAVVSAYRLSEDRSRSLVGAILSRGVAATFSTISSLSKILWRSEPSPTKKSRPKPQAFAKTSPLTCLKDSPRKGERLTLSPSGTLAAITDSLGRILLLDTRALVAVRLWKGYRDASCLFVEMLRNKDKASSSSMHLDYTKSDYCLCLAIHAPRKGIIEVWQMRTGQRLLTIPCPKGSRILQPSTRFSSSAFSSYTPLEVYLFNGDSGQLSVLNRHIG
ncbi:rab3 GTPase-activating protein non-catalytic subunit [Triticum urartu]|uniref:Rab3-GAP regulatory subunit N-terminal domain-containing protein n=2 Tax=Triticum urartu TaxID=4572 RepID=A0A8R7UF98_TRIUA|nr:rab3 GTPase-activating protein non-catalytic subunit [Triticum urartu]